MLKKVAIALALAVVVFGISQMFNTREVTNGQVTVAFTGIDTSCQPCQRNIHKTLSKIIGIKASHVNSSKHILRVTFNSRIMKASWIAHSLNAAGFHPEDVKIIHG
jgi:hypothetical protein